MGSPKLDSVRLKNLTWSDESWWIFFFFLHLADGLVRNDYQHKSMNLPCVNCSGWWRWCNRVEMFSYIGPINTPLIIVHVTQPIWVLLLAFCIFSWPQFIHLIMAHNDYKFISNWAHGQNSEFTCSSVAFPITSSESSTTPLGCGRTGDKSAIMSCSHWTEAQRNVSNTLWI